MSEESVDKNQEQEFRAERSQLSKIMFNPKALAGAFLVYAGIGIPFLLKNESDLVSLLKSQAPMLIGVVVAILGFIMMSSEMSKLRISRREERFVDVDEKRGSDNSDLQLKILKDINSLKNQTSSLTSEKIEELLLKASEKKAREDSALFESFENYFNDIRSVLIEQAHTADKKLQSFLIKVHRIQSGG